MTATNARSMWWQLLAGLAILALGVFFFFDVVQRKTSAPDEVAAGLQLLSRGFSGAGYFHVHPSANNKPVQDLRPDYYIDITEALDQVARVLNERNLSTNDTTEIQKLIGRLAEPSRSRTVGDAKVNVLRLNLAVDEYLKTNAPHLR